MKSLEALDNGSIAELLAREAETAEGHHKLALKRASRKALLWPEEAAALRDRGESLTRLDGVGPSIGRRIHRWLEEPPSDLVVPEIRSEFLTMAAATAVLARRSTWRKKLRGDLQMHTTWSDGSGAVRDMAAEAVVRHYEYIAITDHTKGLKIANGLDERRLAAQRKEIDAVNLQLGKGGSNLTVLHSTEVNVSPLGEVDMDPKALAKLDIVLGSFHSALRRTEDQTERYLAALRNPSIHVLGHPKGRVFNYRMGLTADWSRVFAEAAKLDKAVEIDGYADRQDLKLSLLKIAKREGCRISLGTDAHHPYQLSYIDLALAAAYLAKIPSDRLLNFLSLDDLRTWVQSHRR